MFGAAGPNFHGIRHNWTHFKGPTSVMTLESKRSIIHHIVGKKQKKSGRNFISKNLIYNWCRRLRKLPKRPDRPLMWSHAQCFQIWQVSAKYCTFLDFLPSVRPIVHESFWKHPSMRTKFWVTQWYEQILDSWLVILKMIYNICFRDFNLWLSFSRKSNDWFEVYYIHESSICLDIGFKY